MEWDKLLNLERLNDPDYIEEKHRPAYIKDADRILFSQPFRRLANKTQVHPLYDNDHIHHRLIHSIEVTSVGRSLGIGVGSWLADDRKEITDKQVDIIAGLIQTACMAHDIGNPPFGHSGEDAIGCWFQENFAQGTKGILEDISPEQRLEFESFEGNAQGFRILTRTEMYENEGGMRLALGSLGVFTKYPVSASISKHLYKDSQSYIGLKKYGFFENDKEAFANIANILGLPREDIKDANGRLIDHWWRRHPLAFLMEAADDICYNIMDLEDAYLSGDVDFDTVMGHLGPLALRSNRIQVDQDKDDVVARARALAITGAINACVEAFKNNYDSIMKGNFSISLTEASSQEEVFASIRRVAKSRIFSASRKTELEVLGRNVIYKINDALISLLNDLRANEWNIKELKPYNVKMARAFKFPVHTIKNSYDALHALTDFVSGMTDRYAVKVSRILDGN